jgi:hypothetical protein
LVVRRQLVGIAAVATLAVSCAGPADGYFGTALSDIGPTSNGTVGVSRAGVTSSGRYGFGLPLLKNDSDETVEIMSVTLTHVSSNVRVDRTGAISSDDTDGEQLVSYLGDRTRADFLTLPTARVSDITIAAGSVAKRYPVIYVTVTDPSMVATLSGCLFGYRSGNEDFVQLLPCHYVIEAKRP